MRVLNLIFILIGTFVMSSCSTPSKSDKNNEKKNSNQGNSETQIQEELAVSLNNIEFIFSKPTDPYDLGLYQQLVIKSKDSILLTISHKYFELEGKKFGADKDYVIQQEDRTLYFVEANNRPEPSYFFILSIKDNYYAELIGKTEPLASKILGDIDQDGVIEIGGFNTYCQATDTEDFEDPAFCLDHFRVFEIKSYIQRDTLAEITQKDFLIKSRQDSL